MGQISLATPEGTQALGGPRHPLRMLPAFIFTTSTCAVVEHAAARAAASPLEVLLSGADSGAGSLSQPFAAAAASQASARPYSSTIQAGLYGQAAGPASADSGRAPLGPPESALRPVWVAACSPRQHGPAPADR